MKKFLFAFTVVLLLSLISSTVLAVDVVSYSQVAVARLMRLNPKANFVLLSPVEMPAIGGKKQVVFHTAVGSVTTDAGSYEVKDVAFIAPISREMDDEHMEKAIAGIAALEHPMLIMDDMLSSLGKDPLMEALDIYAACLKLMPAQLTQIRDGAELLMYSSDEWDYSVSMLRDSDLKLPTSTVVTARKK